MSVILDNLDNFVGAREASELSGLSVRTILDLCKAGRAEAVFIGGRYVIAEKWARDERERRAQPVDSMTVTEAMKTTGLSRQRLHQLIKKGVIKSIACNIGPRRRAVWIDRHSLDLWTTSRSVKTCQTAKHSKE